MEELGIIEAIHGKALQSEQIVANRSAPDTSRDGRFISELLKSGTVARDKFLVGLRKSERAGERGDRLLDSLFDIGFAIAQFVFEFAWRQRGKLAMSDGMPTEFKTACGQFGNFPPGHTFRLFESPSRLTNKAGRQEHRCGKIVFLQRRHRVFVEITETVIESDDNGFVPPELT
jgi:hypothetical protein